LIDGRRHGGGAIEKHWDEVTKTWRSEEVDYDNEARWVEEPFRDCDE
jgi:hypothetical protein